MKSVEDLDVFKLSHHLGSQDLLCNQTIPRKELFSLGDQMW
jgi:hypothetical protein